MMIWTELDVRGCLAEMLTTTTLWNGEYFVTSFPCETLYIQVNRIRMSKLALQLILARRKRRRQSRRRRLLRLVQVCPEN